MALTTMSRGQGHICIKKAGVKNKVLKSTKIDFHHRRIAQISDFAELVEMLLPGNKNQQHAAVCVLFELKWSGSIVPNLCYIENKYNVSRRILQRTRAKLSCLGLIEHISYLNSRYGGQQGWKLSSRFERGLNNLAQKCTELRDTKTSSKEKDSMLVEFANAKRIVSKSSNQNIGSKKDNGGENI